MLLTPPLNSILLNYYLLKSIFHLYYLRTNRGRRDLGLLLPGSFMIVCFLSRSSQAWFSCFPSMDNSKTPSSCAPLPRKSKVLPPSPHVVIGWGVNWQIYLPIRTSWGQGLSAFHTQTCEFSCDFWRWINTNSMRTNHLSVHAGTQNPSPLMVKRRPITIRMPQRHLPW